MKPQWIHMFLDKVFVINSFKKLSYVHHAVWGTKWSWFFVWTFLECNLIFLLLLVLKYFLNNVQEWSSQRKFCTLQNNLSTGITSTKSIYHYFTYKRRTQDELFEASRRFFVNLTTNAKEGQGSRIVRKLMLEHHKLNVFHAT